MIKRDSTWCGSRSEQAWSEFDRIGYHLGSKHKTKAASYVPCAMLHRSGGADSGIIFAKMMSVVGPTQWGEFSITIGSWNTCKISFGGIYGVTGGLEKLNDSNSLLGSRYVTLTRPSLM